MKKQKSKISTNTIYWLINILVLILYVMIHIHLIICLINYQNLDHNLEYFTKGIPFSWVTTFLVILPIIQLLATQIFSSLHKNPIKKVISGKYANISEVLCKILLLYVFFTFFTSMFFTVHAYNNSLLQQYLIGYTLLATNSLGLFLLFLTVLISEDSGYKTAKPLFYKINPLNYEEIKQECTSHLMQKIRFTGQFIRKTYTIDYYITEEKVNYIYAFIHVKKLSSSLANYYYNEGIYSFGEYLNNKNQMDVKKQTRIIYFFVVDEENTTFGKLKNATAQYQRQFNMMHVLINLNKQELYISTLKSISKSKQREYMEMKNSCFASLSTIIDERFGDLNEKCN